MTGSDITQGPSVNTTMYLMRDSLGEHHHTDRETQRERDRQTGLRNTFTRTLFEVLYIITRTAAVPINEHTHINFE